MNMNIQFLTTRKILRNNCNKYYFYSMTLDSLVHNCRLEKAESISTGYLINDFKHLTTWSLWNTPIPILELWLGEMVMLGLVIMKQKPDGTIMLSLTEDGFKAYQEQRFHSISASLFEARLSRNLATIAIIAAVISILVSIFF